MKEDLLRVFATLYRRNYSEYIHLSDIYKEMESITNKKVVNKGASIRARLEVNCQESDAFNQKEALFKLKEKGSGLWKSCFYENIIKMSLLKVGDILTKEELLNTFKISGMSGIMKSNKTYSLVLILSDNDIYEDSDIVDGQLIYTGQGQSGDQKLEGVNLTLANSNKNNLPIYLFSKDSHSMFHFEGIFELYEKPYRIIEKNRYVYKYPLRLANISEEIVYSKEDYKKVQKIFAELENEAKKERKLNFIDEPIKIKKYNKNDCNKQLRKGKIDYLTREIVNTTQGDITEKDIFDYEINKVMKFGVKELVEEMKKFFDNKTNDEGYDIKSFDKDKYGNIIEKYIEVKSTKGNETVPIDITSNELEYAKKHKENYFIYRVYNCNNNIRKVKVINAIDLFTDNNFDIISTCYKIYGK